MRNLYLFICMMVTASGMVCIPEPKRKLDTPVGTDNNSRREEYLRYEFDHFNDYTSKTKDYETWPELKGEKIREFCQFYLQKISPVKDLSSVKSEIQPVDLYYKNMEISDGRQLKLFAVQCKVAPPICGRKYFHFVRAPSPDCVYLINHRVSNAKKFYLALEVCKDDTFKKLKNSGKLKIAVNVRRQVRRPRDNDTPEEREQHEKEHLKDYLFDRDIYRCWPELRDDEKKEDHCRTFLKKQFPKSEFVLINPEVKLIQLGYRHIKSKSIIDNCRVEVAVLICNTLKPVHHKKQNFIRAPDTYSEICVYVVKQIQSGRHELFYVIVNRLCVNANNNERQTETSQSVVIPDLNE